LRRPEFGYEPPAHSGDARPAVILWYRVYAATLALVYLAFLAVVVVGAFGPTAVAEDPAMRVTAPSAGAEAFTLVMLLLSLFLFLFFAVATFVPLKPWGWSVAIVAIGIGLMGGCTIFACVPLLVYWLKPVTKAAFGRLPI
jgi:hypothetical protein